MPSRRPAARSKSAKGQLTQLRLDELQIFRKVVESGKSALAARALGLSPSAVSRAISRLEASSGKTLFRHEGNRLVATAEALAFDRTIDPILQGLGEVERGEADKNADQRFRVAVIPSLAQCFLPPIVAGFARSNPGMVMSVTLVAGSAAGVITTVAAGNAELGITNTQGRLESVTFEPLRRSRTHVVVPSGHRLARRSHITVTDLADESLIIPAYYVGRRITLEDLFAGHGVRPKIVAEVASSVLAAELVQLGAGIAVFDAFPVALSEPKGIVFRPLEPEMPVFTRLVWSHSGARNPGARAFADYIKAHQPKDDAYSQIMR
ncbi:MAG: LysR family transcriptional regulator [Bauldia sp.]